VARHPRVRWDGSSRISSTPQSAAGCGVDKIRDGQGGRQRTDQMTIDFGPVGITVNTIAPGHMVTDNMEKLWAEVRNEAGFRLHKLQYPVLRTGESADVAHTVSFLCLPQASFITGVVLPVYGGHSIQLQENIILEIKITSSGTRS